MESESSESLIALNSSFVQENFPNQVEPFGTGQWSQFANELYAIESILSIISASNIHKHQSFFHIPLTVKLRVSLPEERACTLIPREACFFDQALKGSLRFPVPLPI